MKPTAFVFAWVLICTACWAQTTQGDPLEINTAMMQSTFRYQCPTLPLGGAVSTGTVFLLGRPIGATTTSRIVLVTAAHVLSECVGDFGAIWIRQKDLQGHWNQKAIPLQIRSNGKQLWSQHPKADVAAMYIPLPNGAVPPLISTDLLADDALLTRFEVHPGDDLSVLGYPLGVEGPGGFPILRSGRIASYPLVPSKDNPYFLMDFRVFQGNSGGPVFMVSYNRIYHGATNIGAVQMLMGLVSQELSLTQELRGVYDIRSQTYPLSIAKVVPAAFIKETVNQLPEASVELPTQKP